MMRPCLLALLIAASPADAVVIRDDVDDAAYRVPASAFPALADLPGEGHGVLIAPRWVVTAAHAVTWQHEIADITLAGTPRKVKRVVLHPGYRKPPQALLDRGLATWDWTLLRAHLAASDDIALIELAQPVDDVAPVALHEGDAYGQLVTLYGKGATGDGADGYDFADPHRTELRRANNTITSEHDRWLCYVFDEPATALPLEGGTGSGDSGGPVLVTAGEGVALAGLASWVDPQSTARRPGRYGQVSCNVRLAHYRGWMGDVMSMPAGDPSPR